MNGLDNDIVYDELTGVLSFKSFLSEARRILDENPDTEYLLLVWDIERFKVVNDIFGMDMGDNVLRGLADTFRREILKSGIIGRIGGDKFVCLCIKDDISISHIEDKMKYTIETDTEKYRLFVQAGVYYIDDRDIPVIKMCDRALIALNSVKGIHTDKVEVYTETKREELITGQHLVSDMEKGIAGREFFVVIQPIYDVRTGAVAAGEVLVRWNHPKYGLLMPGRFVPVFEKNFMISKLDHFVWEEACRIIRDMIDQGVRVVPLSINVSRVNLYHNDLPDILDGLTAKYNIPREYLRVEITESAYMDNREQLIFTVNRLKAAGYDVMMDDFGTGYSSLNLLKDISFDLLKIDKKLIDEIVVSDRAGNVVSSVVKMAKWLGMSVVAEGVETGNQAAFLKNIGSDYIQGYLYSRPVDVKDFLQKCTQSADNYYRVEFNDIDIDNILNIKDPQIRSFMDELIGPMALCEFDEAQLRLLKVNSEFIRLFKTSPQKLYVNNTFFFSSEDSFTKQRLVDACLNARRKSRAESVIVSHKKSKDSWMWLSMSIRYVGDAEGKSRFIFSVKDITKERNRRNKQQMVDFYPFLCHLYKEIIELNYTEGTVTTLYKDDDSIKQINKKAPMQESIDKFASYVITGDSRNEFISKTSTEYMDKFFNSKEKIFTIEIQVITRKGKHCSCEMTFIKTGQNPGPKTVIACTRVVG